ncbi:CHD3-type chromatin-remodeling factor PICKLE-like isoform X1 [Asparagus officinalis]|nr:CHD3-type chromatin-remodeling factor PICKLE-like isoform X1 [Asparagus officinalis]
MHSYLKKCHQTSRSDFIDERKPEWFKIDRVISCRRKCDSDKPFEILDIGSMNQENGDLEFLVKWMGLDYCDSTWESSCSEELSPEVSRLIQRHQRATERVDNSSTSSGSEALNKIPNELYGGVLYDYQLQGQSWILNNFKARRNVILADEMGLGKTIQVVSFIRCMKQEKLNIDPILIIAPKSILFQWEKEFRNWAKDLNVIIYQGEKQSRRCIRTHEMYASGKYVLFDALITNYELVILDMSTLRKFRWSAIVIDEAHKIKRLDCKLASCLKQYSSDFRLLLTGTPLQNTLLELFVLLNYIDPERFSDPEAEAESYKSIKSLSPPDIEKKIAEIHELLRPRMLRRMKSDVLPGSIPVKKWVEVPCALTDYQRELYINILEKNHEKLSMQIQNGRKSTLKFILMELKKCCNHPYLFPGMEPCLSSEDTIFSSLVSASGKLQLLEKLLPRLKYRGNRVLLFSQMVKMLDILEDFLMFLGMSYFRIDGSTPIAARQEQMRDFNDPNSQVFVFLISTRAGGLGIDLPTADRVIIYDPDFNPFNDLQAQSRAHRIGQTRPVVVYQLITKCSVEVKILQKSKEKLAIENLVMNPSKIPSVSELHSVLLHGARTILNKENIKATTIHYDDKAIDALLKLDPEPGGNCSPDDNGYLGSIQNFVTEDDENGKLSSPKAKEWENILGPVEDAKEEDGNLGRGKRQKKKEVNYECEESDSDDIYSPESSSSSDSDDSDFEAAYDEM